MSQSHQAEQKQPKRVILINAVTEDEEEDTAVVSKNSKAMDVQAVSDLPKRRLARGFTITVSPPSAEVGEPVIMPPENQHALDEISQTSSGITIESLTDEALYEELLPRRKIMARGSEDYLAPEEPIPSVSLDHTVSRLPSLEDMLADEELRKLLNTSEVHREVQDMILVESDHTKYENIMVLVEKSFKDENWRIQAAKDKALIDTLILLIRQRLTASRNPHQTPGADFMPKVVSRSTGNSSFYRPLYSRSATMNSTEGNQSVTATTVCQATGHKNSPVMNELAVKSSIHLTILSAVVKLLRNLCLNVEDCQIYLHEHRIIDLLFDHIDMIMEIVYWTHDNASSVPIEDDANEKLVCPKWAIEEINGFPRAFIQLITNVVSKQSRAQAHILHYIFPANLLNAIILSGDADLLFCLLHCLIDDQPADIIYETFILDPEGVKAIYYLLAYATILLENFAENLTEKLKWGVLFMNSFLLRKQSYPLLPEESVPFKLFHFLGRFFEHIVEKVEPKSYISTASKTLRRTASFKVAPGFTGILTSRRCSHEVPRDWAEFVSKKAQTLLDLPQECVVQTFLLLLQKAFELYHRDWSYEVWSKTIGLNDKSFQPCLHDDSHDDTQTLNCVDPSAQNVLLQYCFINLLHGSSSSSKSLQVEPNTFGISMKVEEIIGSPENLPILVNITLNMLCASYPCFSSAEEEQEKVSVKLVEKVFKACLDLLQQQNVHLNKKLIMLTTIEKIIQLMTLLTYHYHDIAERIVVNKKGLKILLDNLVYQVENNTVSSLKSQNYVQSLYSLMIKLCSKSPSFQSIIKNEYSKYNSLLKNILVTDNGTFMDILIETFQE